MNLIEWPGGGEEMPRTVSATEAKDKLGGIMAWVRKNDDDVIIESRGRPNAVIVSIEEYQRILAWRERARREEALARLERLRQRIGDRNQDLSDEEAVSLADEVSREAVDRLIRKGKISYQDR
jgi:prevent-host-death family protein